jgi:hypothetical protein
MLYPAYLTQEDIELFELDMARFEMDPSIQWDSINMELQQLSFNKAETDCIMLYDD